MTKEQATKAKEITQNIENVEKILNFLNNSEEIIFTDRDRLFPSRYMLYSNELNTKLKTAIIDTLITMNKELEDELAGL